MINERNAFILTHLLQNKEPVQIKSLIDKFNVSNRTIRYDLDAIDEFLVEHQLPKLLRKPNMGISFSKDADDRNKTSSLLKNLNYNSYILSKEERIKVLISELLSQKEYTTIEKLGDKVMVSRNTIKKDLIEVKKWLENYGIKILASPKKGLKAIGDEKVIRRASIEIFTGAIDIDKALEIIEAPFYTRFNIGMYTQLKGLLGKIDIIVIEHALQMAEKELNQTFSDDAYSNLVIHIAIAVKRITLKRDIIMPLEELSILEGCSEFQVAKKIARELEQSFNLQLPKDEIGYITVHLLGSSITKTSFDLKDDFIGLQLLTEKLILTVSEKLEVDLTVDEQLFEGLIAHLRPALYRVKHNLVLKNPMLFDIKDKYPLVFQAVKQSINPIEKKLENCFSEHEIGYLTMHFAAARERGKERKFFKPNILLVCSTGIGTSKILSASISKRFNVNIVDTVGYHEVDKILKEKDIDLILTTITLKEEKVTWIKINPILTQEDIKRLEEYLNSAVYANAKTEKLIKIIQKHCEIQNYDALTKELKFFLEGEEEIRKDGWQPMLKEVLNENYIDIDVTVANWEDAVRKGGQLLLNENAVEKRYIDAMIATVKEMGPYIVIAPGIAMPHARPEFGAKKIGMSLITLKEPICFGNEKNDPVRIVISLCAVDHSSHLKALSELMEILGDEDKIQVILNAKDKQEIIDLIRTIE